MKKIAITLLVALSAMGAQASSWSLKNLLGGAEQAVETQQETTQSQQDNSGGLLGGLLGLADNLFSNSDFDLSQLKGTWTVTGSAVAMKGEGALAGAAGKAAAVALQKKLDPYYKQYGLTGGTLTVEEDGTFTLQMKKLNLTGTIEKTGEGEYSTTFNGIGGTTFLPMDTYFQKGVTGQNLDVMFDASRMLSFMQSVSAVLPLKSLQTVSSLLSQYDNLYVGFKLKKTSN